MNFVSASSFLPEKVPEDVWVGGDKEQSLAVSGTYYTGLDAQSVEVTCRSHLYAHPCQCYSIALVNPEMLTPLPGLSVNRTSMREGQPISSP